MPSRHARVFLATALTALAIAGCGRSGPASGTPAATTTPPAVQERLGYDGALPPLPVVQFASARPAPIIRAAYEFAARHPDVLRHIPCFCGCERNGHGNNEDCFVAKRNADRSPEWSPHGIGCGICIDVAMMARQMHADGSSVADIRRAVDTKYRSEFPTSTPTPHPPH
jgi:predicted small lipoprotein YifL